MADSTIADAFVAPTFGQRFGGRLLDSLLLLPIAVVLTITLERSVSLVLVFAISATYEIGGIALWGQTVGKRVVGTRVVSAVSADLRPVQAVVRFLVYAGGGFVLAEFGIRVLPAVWTLVVVLPVLRLPLHRGLHDYAARTIVVPTRTWSMSPPR